MTKSIYIGGIALALFAAGLLFFANAGSSNVAADVINAEVPKQAACQALATNGSCGCTQDNGTCGCGLNGSSCSANTGSEAKVSTACGCASRK